MVNTLRDGGAYCCALVIASMTWPAKTEARLMRVASSLSSPGEVGDGIGTAYHYC